MVEYQTVLAVQKTKRGPEQNSTGQNFLFF